VYSHCFSQNETEIALPMYPPPETTIKFTNTSLANVFTKRVATVVTNQGWYFELNRNPHLTNRIEALPTGCWWQDFDAMFKPTPAFLTELEKILPRFEGAFVIGVHVRGFQQKFGEDIHNAHIRNSTGVNAWDKFVVDSIKCGTEAANSTDKKNLRPPVTRTYRKQFSSTLPAPVKFFVATDTDEVREAFRTHLGADNVITTDDFGAVVHFDRQSADRRNGILRILLDAWLLGESNELLITSVSNFGRVGSLRRHMFPIPMFWMQPNTCARFPKIADFLRKEGNHW